MPELPDVEGTKLALTELCLDTEIDLINDGNGTEVFDKKIFDCKPALLTEMRGKRFESISRRGKYLIITMSSPPHAVIHFGLNGVIAIQGVECVHARDVHLGTEWPPKFCRLLIRFSNTREIAFCDQKRLSCWTFTDDPIHSAPLNDLAPDPVLDDLSFERFCEVLKSKKKAIKTMLMDQSLLACGIGNWLADEICFQSHLLPRAKSNTLSSAQSSQLFHTLIDVCRYAASAGGDQNKYPRSWIYHYRWDVQGNEKSRVMEDGKVVKFDTLAGRVTAYCPSVQRMGGDGGDGDEDGGDGEEENN
eukprot:c17691_g1_i1.p1 GENE.c17691_g1_i1~~c17691_g1_i1.p1  ORF type:complete len:313 (+),score=82.86 c17691_g1_i1:29-940(+)